MLATFVGEKNPQLRELLKLNDSEAQNMAEAVCNVTQYYDITPNPVVMAWINLAVVAGAVYVPRIVLYQQMTK